MTKTNELAWEAALHAAPTNALEAEVKRRGDKKFLDEIPKLHVLPGVEDPFRTLMELCASYISQLAEEEPYDDEKIVHYIFEEAIKVFFGKDVFKWVTKRLQ